MVRPPYPGTGWGDAGSADATGEPIRYVFLRGRTLARTPQELARLARRYSTNAEERAANCGAVAADAHLAGHLTTHARCERVVGSSDHREQAQGQYLCSQIFNRAEIAASEKFANEDAEPDFDQSNAKAID